MRTPVSSHFHSSLCSTHVHVHMCSYTYINKHLSLSLLQAKCGCACVCMCVWESWGQLCRAELLGQRRVARTVSGQSSRPWPFSLCPLQLPHIWPGPKTRDLTPYNHSQKGAATQNIFQFYIRSLSLNTLSLITTLSFCLLFFLWFSRWLGRLEMRAQGFRIV